MHNTPPYPTDGTFPGRPVLKAGSRPYAGPWGDGPTPQLHHSGGPTPSSGISSIHPSTLGTFLEVIQSFVYLLSLNRSWIRSIIRVCSFTCSLIHFIVCIYLFK